MRVLKSLFKWLCQLLLALLVFGFAPAITGFYGPYAKRYAVTLTANPLDPASSWYDVRETVRGGGGTPLPAARPGEDPFQTGVLEAAARYAGEHASDALLVLHDGRLVFERYWNGKGPDSRLVAHSMTKTLNAMLIGQVIADGRIGSVDDPAYFHLAEWDREGYRAITIRHLLHMASGLRESDEFWPWSPRMQRVIGTDIVAANLAVPLDGPPAVAFAHIDPPAQLLGAIIERATGERYADYLSRKIWQPLGAHDAELFVDRPGGMVHTDCCLLTTIQDWARIGEVLRTTGLWQGQRVLPAGWVYEMVAPSPAYMNYGMMVWLGNTHDPQRSLVPGGDSSERRHSEPFADGVFYLDGRNAQRVWVVPKRDLVIVRTGGSHPDWDEARIPNLLIRGMRR